MSELLTSTRNAKIALNDARKSLDSIIRRNRDDSQLCPQSRVDEAWDRVEALHAEYLAAKALYHAACAA